MGASRLGRAIPREGTPGTHWIGDWVGPRTGLDTDTTGKSLSPLPGIERRNPGRPVRSQILYWLIYPGSTTFCIDERITSVRNLMYLQGVVLGRLKCIHQSHLYHSVASLRYRLVLLLAKLKTYKFARCDHIPEDLFQAGVETLKSQTHKLFELIWNKELPQQCKQSIAVSVQKKGHCTDCTNHIKWSKCQCISSLSAWYNILSNNLLCVLTPYAD
jgi:hypothetical protein